jgi:hypothetical protein
MLFDWCIALGCLAACFIGGWAFVSSRLLQNHDDKETGVQVWLLPDISFIGLQDQHVCRHQLWRICLCSTFLHICAVQQVLGDALIMLCSVL